MRTTILLLTTLILFFQTSVYAQEDTSEIEENTESPAIEKLSAAERKLAKLDFNSDGIVDFKEYQNANMNINRKDKNYSIKALKISKRFAEIDSNKNNKLELSELEMAMMPKNERNYLSKKHEIFSKIDRNHDDGIDFEEFSRISSMGKTIKYRKGGTEKEKEKKFAWFDADNNDVISFEEFKIDKSMARKK